MSADFAATLAAIERMKHEGVVADYAVGGAMALVFWTEPVPTFDLDVFVLLPAEATTPLVSLDPMYRWAETNGYVAEGEHILIEGVPVQFIPSPNPLADEAIEAAARLDYEGVSVRVMRPEHLIALYLEPGARTAKRLQRAAALVEESIVDATRLQSILSRYNLKLPW
jgi:hypothetical protein